MDSDLFWSVFETTGSIEAFLAYSASEEKFDISNVALLNLLDNEERTTQLGEDNQFKMKLAEGNF